MEKIFEQQTMYCKEHTGNKISYFKINFQGLDSEIFRCGQCALEDSSIKDYLNIESINNSQDDYIFSNWPPICNQKLTDELKQLFKNYVDIEYKIESQFKDLTNEILQAIELKKKEVLNVCSSLKVEKELISRIYNQISSKDELKKILNSDSCIELYKSDLIEFLKKKHEEKESNNLQFQLMIEKIKRYQDIPQIFNFCSIKTQFSQQLNKLDDQIKEYDFFRENINEMQNQLDILIKNKLNEEIQDFDYHFNCFAKGLWKNSENQDFDIFQTIKSTNIYFSKQNQIKLLRGKEQFGSDSKSQDIKVTQHSNQNVISVYKNQEIDFGEIYFKHELSKNKKYTIRFKFNDEGGKYIIIGLINKNNLNGLLSLTKQGKSFCFQSPNHGGNIVKGDYFYTIKKGFTLQMNIDIESKQIQYLDFPLKTSINQLQNEFLLDSESIYYLTIQFGKQTKQIPFETVIDIIHFEEIEKI
ncbi:hypothetical protein TTHERM_00286800 (macronuclear) [Tetrahymena thermophila SB210]|uniref:Zinc carboxypeptidase family protein n=1 Tax=Tetrahymena thermophila (strain SB210) TaxID=312017 RepID=I7M225_TETTS|nr:hypothetical protein TTHERM_00286800 [Tetrahymena thermophila SB210]EAR98350.2 hypothetical protein TTHERM_00286800 [Tetrahymena thermophila SB210]|eukprot:XP_001018595.2 hypothetical protein TTHERM_00286800 [Tetrahymena thermophila SB210]